MGGRVLLSEKKTPSKVLNKVAKFDTFVPFINEFSVESLREVLQEIIESENIHLNFGGGPFSETFVCVRKVMRTCPGFLRTRLIAKGGRTSSRTPILVSPGRFGTRIRQQRGLKWQTASKEPMSSLEEKRTSMGPRPCKATHSRSDSELPFFTSVANYSALPFDLGDSRAGGVRTSHWRPRNGAPGIVRPPSECKSNGLS
jgi:hypothetical protein